MTLLQLESLDHFDEGRTVEPSLTCPACGAQQIVRGRLGDAHPGTFTPEGLRFWTLTAGVVPLHDRSDPGSAPASAVVHACAGCGLVWSHLDPERLRMVLREAGTEATRAEHGPDAGDSS